MKRRLLTVAGFFLITPVYILFIAAFYSYLSYHKASLHSAVLSAASSKTLAFAALPITQEIASVHITQQDARVELVKQFFQRYGSPLSPFAQNVVDAADQYGIDFRYIPAIAMQESTLCRGEITGTHNCWGFGIYGKKVTSFDSYSQAIDVVTRTLAKEYKGKGLETPVEIMSKYNPSNHNDWAKNVTSFMADLQ